LIAAARNDGDQGSLFDLDGTFADTALDLAAALITPAPRANLPPLAAGGPLRPQASHGSRGLLKPASTSSRNIRLMPCATSSSDYYANNICVHYRLFGRYSPAGCELERRDIKWGIVTISRTRYLPWMQALGMASRAACLNQRDTLCPRQAAFRAYAQGMRTDRRHACQCLYLGDDLRDMQAAMQPGCAASSPATAMSDPMFPSRLAGAGSVNQPTELSRIYALSLCYNLHRINTPGRLGLTWVTKQRGHTRGPATS